MNRSQIATDLLSNDIQIRLSALSTLGEQDQQTPLAPDICRSLLQCLGHNQKNVQRAAAAHLIHFAPNQPEIFTALTHTLSDPDSRIRWTAAFTLSQLDLPGPSPLPVLIENLGHQESDLRWAAATALLHLAEQHRQAVVSAMIRLVYADNAVQRRMALYCLRDLGQTGHEAQAAYLASLNDADAMVRLGGLSCLGKLRLTSVTVRETMLRLLLNDPDMGVRRSTAVTLGQIGDSNPAVLEALRAASRDADTSLHKAAARALVTLSKDL